MPAPDLRTGPRECCSADSRGASIVGSAPREAAYLIVEFPKPWPKKVKAEGALAEFKSVLKGGKEELKLLATPRIDWLPLCQRPWALLVRWKDGQALVQELPAKADDVKAAMEAPPAGEPSPLYLVCTHGTRDRCCGTLGFPVYRSLLEASSRKVLQVTHLGGHRYAPVVLALPEWRFFGHVDPVACLDMDGALNEKRPYLAGYRGHGRLAADLQPVEASLWQEYGPELERLTKHGGGDEEFIVRATFSGGTERAYKAHLGRQEFRGYKSCEDICDGKPKLIELPALQSLEEISLASLRA